MAAFPTITTKLSHIPSKDFTKERILGQGGFGKVYFGRWETVPIAVKELLVQTISDTFIKTFRSEAEVMASCQHPNTVRLYGVCLEEGKLALLMEYLDKGPLYNLLSDTSIPLSWHERFRIATDTASGLSYIHSLKIVHRDLKSLNVLLAKDGTAKIADFGLAQIRLETSSRMTTGQLAGSPRWMAPEQFSQNAPASFFTDIYSFGMILWEIASRKIPFSHATNEYIVIAAKMNNTQETIPSDTPEEYAALIKNCWKTPRERPIAKNLVKELVNLQTKNPSPPSQPIAPETPSHLSNPVASSYASNTVTPLPKVVALPPPNKPSLPDIAFGKEQWAKYLGDIGSEPPLPSNIQTILQSPCPFWPDKKIKDTHLLVLVPQTVNGKPLTLKNLGELVKSLKSGSSMTYTYFNPGGYNANTPAKPSHWVLMTKDVIPGSRGKSYANQQKLVNQTPSYQVPTILEAATCIFMEYARSGNRVYSDNLCTYTRCQERYNEKWQLIVGGFSDDGIDVDFYQDRDTVGVGGLLRL